MDKCEIQGENLTIMEKWSPEQQMYEKINI